MDTTGKVIYGGSLLLAMIAGACLMAIYLQRKFDREMDEERDLYYEEQQETHTGFTEELTAILSDGAGVPAEPLSAHYTEPIRVDPPTPLELRLARTQHGYIPDLAPEGVEAPPGLDDNDAPTLIRLTRTTVTESVMLPSDHLDTECSDAILEVRRRFDLIRQEMGERLELVGSH